MRDIAYGEADPLQSTIAIKHQQLMIKGIVYSLA